MNAVLDIIIIGIIIVCVALGYKNGFIKTVMNFLSFIVAFIMAKTFSAALSSFFYSKWIEPNLISSVAGKIEKFLTPNINLNTLVQDQPADFTKLLNGYGVKIPDVKAWISEAAAKGASNATEFVARKLVEPVAKGLADFISFAVIFVVSFVLLRIVAMLINKAVKVSGLNRINKAGGVILGLLYGVTASYIFVFLVYYILPYLAANTPLISSWEPVVNGTVFFKWLYEHFPLKNVMG